jgi:lysophospholipase L1-like esterase
MRKLFAFIALTSMAILSAQDWPHLQKYQSDNAQILREKTSVRVVFMGNSITQGWADMRPEFFKEHGFVGRGIGGQTTPQMLLRFRQDVLELKPKAVVILAGINDIAQNTVPLNVCTLDGGCCHLESKAPYEAVFVLYVGFSQRSSGSRTKSWHSISSDIIGT